MHKALINLNVIKIPGIQLLRCGYYYGTYFSLNHTEVFKWQLVKLLNYKKEFYTTKKKEFLLVDNDWNYVVTSHTFLHKKNFGIYQLFKKLHKY